CRVAAQNNRGITEGAVTPFYPTSSAVTQKAVTFQGDVAHTGRAVFGLPLAFQVAPSWQLTFPDKVSYPIVANGLAYVIVRGSASGAYGTRLYALDLASGNTVWGPVAIGGTFYWAAQAYENGTLFVINFDGLLRAFDAVGGTLKWSTQLPGQYSFSAAPTAQNGVVYVGGSGSGGTLYAVNASSGAVLWTRPVANGDDSSPALGDNGVYVSYPGQVYKFDPVSGAQIWHYSGSVSGGGGSTPAYFNGMLFVRDWAVNPVGAVFNTATGAKGKTFGNFNMIPIPAFGATDGYFMMYGTLQSFDPSSLGSHWSFTGDGHLVSAPLVIDDVVVVGSSSGTVYAVDAASGVQKWSGQAGAAIAAPNEGAASAPLTGFAAGEGYLLVPAENKLSAWHIAGQ
ncbi:MAG TPA: PQQ-binding-like beta-propeller repeat protein, partial [Geobacteraceae bacterium]